MVERWIDGWVGEGSQVERAVTPLQPLETLGFFEVLPVTFTRYKGLQEPLRFAASMRQGQQERNRSKRRKRRCVMRDGQDEGGGGSKVMGSVLIWRPDSPG